MKQRFVSLDRHSVCVGEYDEPDRYREIVAVRADTPLIARGAGLSYVAASFGEGVRSIGLRRFDRILAFDAAERWIEVEAGVSLGKLYNFCLQHGLGLPVQPGHPQITVGGCIAGNVHGKNQFREGLFGDHVLSLRLFHPRHGIFDLSRQRESSLFELTVGGLGLTGLIVSARLALAPLSSDIVEVEHIATDSIDETFARVATLRTARDLVYGWIDLAQRDGRCRGYVVVASTLPPRAGAGSRTRVVRPLDPGRQRFRPPLFNARTMPLVNRLYRSAGVHRSTRRSVPLFDVLFPAVGKEFYFDWFGAGGFVEMQVLVPEKDSTGYVQEVIKLIRRHEQPIVLTTVKAFAGAARLLHYTGSGFSFSLDVPNTPGSLALLADLDDLNCANGVKSAVLKDSRLPAAAIRRQYADYEEFRDRIRSFDPARSFQSSLSRRLDL
ncbi:MAG TPA: FAD-binding oxidoreductase [Xanthobacteraceae bacterium]|jgi:decaprenylphospho-beta-D-ribofuranose 2-oxidase